LMVEAEESLPGRRHQGVLDTLLSRVSIEAGAKCQGVAGGGRGANLKGPRRINNAGLLGGMRRNQD